MRIPFVWRRTAEANEQAWKERIDYWRERAESAERDLKAEVNARRTATTQFSDLFDQHQQLTRDHARLAARPAQFDDDKARKAATRIERLVRGVARARTEAAAEARRADHLQTRLDDAVGLGPRGIKDSRTWQPGYRKPKEDAS
ncbi:hypothetical protein ACFZBC_08825 [Streptomyces luteogriseus]|uniref:hypothetical protein n=1 Tax=Streptomyces luteogriseus TaxID=68233 RepID=UPI0036F08341